MMSGAILRSWKTVKQHVPLIKFRKGGPHRENTPSASSQASGTSATIKATSSATNQQGVIEDWQLPPHYRRAPLDEQEMDAINSGGAY